jgi:uncharacterized protein involved in exopolysaccharide biosynthesis
VQDHASVSVQGPINQADEIDLGEVWRRVRVGWKLIAFVALIATASSVALSYWMTPIYEATVVLAISTPDDESLKSGGLSKLASQFGAASDILDFGGSSNRSAESVATLQSRVLTETYIREQNLLPILFAAQWDSVKGEWKKSGDEKPPSLWDGNKVFAKKIRLVTEDKKTGLVTLTIAWKNKQQAAQWASDLVARANSYLQQKALDESSRHIQYLNEELKRTNVLELQQAIFRLLEVEIKKTMLARGNPEYAFKTIDPAVVPQEVARPKRSLIVAVGGVGGLLVGVMIALVRYASSPVRGSDDARAKGMV